MNSKEAEKAAKALVVQVWQALNEDKNIDHLIEQHEAYVRDYPEIDWSTMFREVVVERFK